MAGESRFGPVGIIDIGSNSVRFVAYAGTARVPSTIFNEKVVASLGRSLAIDNRIDEEAAARAISALARFRQLARDMGLKRVHTVATAAVRDADNGEDFLRRARELGLKPRLLSGEEEAEYSGLGVISAIPRAAGLAADLGGGSLEITGLARGEAGAGVSLPLGVLRIARLDRADLVAAIRKGIKGTRLAEAAAGQSLYLVGGSFRALAQLDLRDQAHPLPIVHQHRLTPDRIKVLSALVATGDTDLMAQKSGLSGSRIATLPGALKILGAMRDTLEPKRVVVSAFGLREGLLYRDLPGTQRAEDPLLAAALEVGERLGRFGDHGALLDEWIDPLFPNEEMEAKRIRLTACLLGDIGWNAHPDFRAERAVDLALHGNWVAIDAHGRALLGRALWAAFGDDSSFDPRVLALLRDGEDARAQAWGRAIRLAQRLSAGTEGTLRRTSVALTNRKVKLTMRQRDSALYAEAVERRLAQLAKALGREAEVVFA
ncbi:Ppx/GppA family phosphatase [Sphingomonas sp. ASV193]|uniref:Ppx/GppA phosphatase family protein n=1 Tax=Sphingomonas sp. ASV193 TaxID=3144405 RepID=UPI0032E8AEFD